MKVLSVRQPWAWLIMQAGKDIENRSWATNYRGPLAIHAARRYDDMPSVHTALRRMCRAGVTVPEPDELTYGAIIGVVDLVDCVQGIKSPWAFKGHWHWVLENPRPVEPIPLRGQLGLFDLPTKVKARG